MNHGQRLGVTGTSSEGIIGRNLVFRRVTDSIIRSSQGDKSPCTTPVYNDNGERAARAFPALSLLPPGHHDSPPGWRTTRGQDVPAPGHDGRAS